MTVSWKKRLLVIILLYTAAAGLLVLSVRDPLGIYPQKEILTRDELEIHGMKAMRESWLRATEEDPHVIIPDVNCRVRVVELNMPKRKYRRSTDVSMLLFYDTGEGFSEEQSVAAVIKKGTTRFFLPEGTYVTRLRIDFVPIPGNSVSFKGLRINPPDLAYPNAPAVLIGAGVLFALALIMALYARPAVFLREGCAAFGVALAAGLPLIRSAKSGALIQGFALAFSVFLMLTALIVCEGRQRERLYLVFLLLTAGLLSFYWGFLSPGGEGPDEGMRLAVVEYIHHHGTLPRGDDPEIRDAIWGFSYAYYPILPYMIAGYLARAAELLPGLALGGEAVLRLARSVNAAAQVLAVFYAFRLAGLLFPGNSLRFGFPAMFAFFPQLVFISTYVNTDCFAMLSSCMIIFYWVRGQKSGWALRDAAGLSASMAICALSYYYYYGFILLSVPFVFVTALASGKRGKEVARLAAFIALLTFALAGWWFIRNLILYDGDLFARTTLNRCAEEYALDYYKPSNIPNPRAAGQSLAYMLFDRGWIRKTMTSFVAVFSNLTVYVRPHVYTFYKMLTAAGLTGLLLRGLQMLRGCGGKMVTRTEADGLLLPAVLFLAACIPFGLAVYYSYTADFQPQGRYALGALVPLLIFVGKGLEALDKFASERIPSKRAESRRSGADRESASGTGGRRPLQPGSLAGAMSALIMLNIYLDTVLHAYLK